MRISDREQSFRRSPPPDYTNRSVQIRLLVLVGMFMTVLILIVEAGKSENWFWMWGGKPHVEGHGWLEPAEIAHKDIDTRLDGPSNRQLANPDTVTADSGGNDVLIGPPAEKKQSERTDDSPYKAPAAEFFEGVVPELLEEVEDDRVLRGAEHHAWFHLLAILKRTNQQRLREASQGRIGFVQLFEQSKTYRGKLVTVRGTVHRTKWVEAKVNDYGIDGYFICWLQPAGGPNSPIVVYSFRLPSGFPQGQELRTSASFTGFYFKRMAYAAQDGARTAPLILAKTCTWTPPAQTAKDRRDPPRIGSVALAVAVTAGLATCISLIVYVRSRSAGASTAYTPQGRVTDEQLTALDGLPARPGPSEMLRRMETREVTNPSDGTDQISNVDDAS